MQLYTRWVTVIPYCFASLSLQDAVVQSGGYCTVIRRMLYCILLRGILNDINRFQLLIYREINKFGINGCGINTVPFLIHRKIAYWGVQNIFK